MADLSSGERQRAHTLRGLSWKARVLIRDEPTAVLTPAEARELFAALRRFAGQGNHVIFTSRKLDEVLEIAHRITVLRAGRRVAIGWAADCKTRSPAQMMVGREIVLTDLRGRPAGAIPPSSAPVIGCDRVSAGRRL